MNRLAACLTLVLLILAQPAQAKLSVSPVIVEEEKVTAGESFAIFFCHEGQEQLEVELSLALFDQDAWGSVVLLEDVESVAKAEEYLGLDQSRLCLAPGENQKVQVRVKRDDFDHLAAALLARPLQQGMPTRLAVLLLVSSGEVTSELCLSSWEQQGTELTLSVKNGGRAHGIWKGEVHLFDADGRLGDTLPIQSGVVLPGRRRDFQVSLPSWVRRVDVWPRGLGEQ